MNKIKLEEEIIKTASAKKYLIEHPTHLDLEENWEHDK